MSDLETLVRTRADLSGAEVTVWWTGDVYAHGPGLDHTRLFGFEGLNVSRAVEVEGGFDLLSREAAFYLDPGSRALLREWANPWTGESVEVLPVLNDPVNQRWREQTPWGPFRLPTTDLGDRVCFNIDIPLAYPSPLPVADFPDNSADDTYRALELFSFFTDRAALASDAASVPCELTWVRQSPWLPWMRMGSRPGGLVFHTRGRKLSSYAELPGWLRDHLAAEHPVFARAPEEFSEPNETSWTAFGKRAATR